MEVQELLMTAARSFGVYLFMLVVIRLLGKREIGSFSAFDLLVALMLGEVVDEVIYGDVNPLQGAVAVLVIALAQYASGWASCLDHGIESLLEGKPTVIIRDGEIIKQGLNHERLSPHDLMSQLRLAGIDDVREVKLAVVEPNGQISTLKEKWAEPIQKADLGVPESEEKQADTAGLEDPPEEKNTLAKKYLEK